ncbi:riboflavin kinase / FMN adenylyltransferase [Bacillus sp. OV166]|nr:riboflavin kinase / FMN adenylyltransferase [Bacillus sp. OV166]
MLKYYKNLFNTYLKELEHGSYITIGSFDGVHKGHQQLISNIVMEGKKRNCPTIVITFDPLPKSFFSHNDLQSSRITSPHTRAERIAALGVDILIEYTFDYNFSTISSDDFIHNVLLGLNPKKFFVGKDFRFGYKGSGNPEVLKQTGSRLGFETEIVEFTDLGNERISSTRVRHAIHNGDLKLASDLMGKQHELCGRIVRTMNDFKGLFFPDSALILPPEGEYWVNINNSNKYFTKAIILNTHKSVEIDLDKIRINSFSKDKVIVQFLQSVTTIVPEEIELEIDNQRHSILS